MGWIVFDGVAVVAIAVCGYLAFRWLEARVAALESAWQTIETAKPVAK